ncbi:phosphotransferase family protein [Enterococcus sp. S86.2]|uniref:phosphotransferase family protein n=1 Tax=Enterococcus sp. S86.2 TaxID=3031299 RepID=UPI0026E9E1AC|nr:phosphotransferase family protein [Enterococcus sp. S86.2]
MDIQLGQEWNLSPIKGDTGKAYVGSRENDKVFVKRNTTPMLAALSKEGITPRLIWTKRTGNGDTFSAQEWLEGTILTAEEIGKRNDVVDVLYQLHHSHSLKRMLQKIGGEVLTPKMMLEQYESALANPIAENRFLQLVLHYLKHNIPEFTKEDVAVVHGDVNHRNWLVCRNYLYLVDWDSICFSDPAVDIGTFLGHYLPKSSWSRWLMSYGMMPNGANLEKVYWYALMSLIQEVKKYYVRGDFETMNEVIIQIKRIFSE